MEPTKTKAKNRDSFLICSLLFYIFCVDLWRFRCWCFPFTVKTKKCGAITLSDNDDYPTLLFFTQSYYLLWTLGAEKTIRSLINWDLYPSDNRISDLQKKNRFPYSHLWPFMFTGLGRIWGISLFKSKLFKKGRKFKVLLAKLFVLWNF